jgi:hypothetical protein
VVTAGAAVGAVPDSALARRPNRAPEVKPIIVQRFKTRKTKSCRACKLHHTRFVFKTRGLADAHRAHPGCDCPIVPQPISKKVFRRLFPRGFDGVAQIPRPGDFRPGWDDRL